MPKQRRNKQATTLMAIRRQLLIGSVLCAMLIFALGGWAATAQLAGAIIAPAVVVVENNVKEVQHHTGGIVAEINVKDGTYVEEGDVVMRLDSTVAGASLAMVSKTLDELRGRRARLRAEQAGADSIDFPSDLLKRAQLGSEAALLIDGERALFKARAAARDGKEAQLRERIAQLSEEVSGLKAQLKAKQKEIAFINEELSGVESLHARNLVPLTRVTALRRDMTRLEGEKGKILSAIAQARGKIAETKLQIIQIEQDHRTEVLGELRQIDARLGELMERKLSAEDQFKRTEIRAPQAGIVHELVVHTVGGVVSPGDTLMRIVPQEDSLSVEARVAPHNIDQVHLDQPVRLRFTAFDQNKTPEITGTVSLVSADITKDPRTDQNYYAIRISISEEESTRLKNITLVPGMPAEAYFQTHMRTALSYLAKPLTDQFSRAFREK